MRSKKVILLLAVFAVVAVWILATRDPDEQLADDLLRREQSRQSTVSTDSQTGQFAPEMFQLTNRLLVEKEDGRSVWQVVAKGDRSSVRVPFLPEINLTLEQPSANRSSRSEETSGDVRVSSDGPGNSAVGLVNAESESATFVGAQACAACHGEKHSGFIHTAHHVTSAWMGDTEVHGEFSGEKSRLATRDPALSFQMSREGDQYFQKVDFADWSLSVPMNVVTGSAKTGQTFLYWHEDALFQAHVSYLSTLDEWIPSPGYPDTVAEYTRAIRPACLECHITYIETTRPPNHYDASSAIWGISCERCHGPGSSHVDFHSKHPNEKKAKYIAHPGEFSRQRQLELCGQCHSGLFKLLQDPFAYRPGDELAKFHRLNDPNQEGVGGIHTSNQLNRLSMSACFQNSEMTCTTCHNPHQDQHGNTAVFTQACLECHQPEHCRMSDELGARGSENCIDCHMPRGDNENMTLQVSGGTFTVQMIDHYIRVDQGATDAWLEENASPSN
jgi:cytochrome c553